MAASTSFRRARAWSGFWNGSKIDGAWGRPAMSADSSRLRLAACFEK
jgi:hypothetical protein